MTSSCPNLVLTVSQAVNSKVKGTLTFSVQPWIVPRFLAGINMDPSPLMLRVHLRPYMVFSVPYPSDATSHSPAQHGKTISPLAATTPPYLQQCPYISKARKSFVCSTLACRTPVKLNSGGTSGGLVRCRRSKPSGYCRRSAIRTCWVVDKLKKVVFEPSENLS